MLKTTNEIRLAMALVAALLALIVCLAALRISWYNERTLQTELDQTHRIHK